MASDEVTLPAGATPDGTSIEPPRHLGRYTIGHVLGSGGMGVVLAAHDPELDRAVALKLMHQGEPEDQRRLLREAQAMARLRHPNVVTVHDVGVTDGRVFVAMELIDGTTLRAWLRESTRPWREIIARFIAAGRGLAAAHAAGIVHRDFKADNVLLGDDGCIRVADFGLAGTEDERPDGVIMGTPAYMAPEQHDGEPAGPPADQYAFAASLWEALCGTRPFVGGTRDELSGAKRAHRIEPQRGPAPRWAFNLLRRAMAPAPGDRHPSMAVLVRALERGLHRRRLVLTAAAVTVAIAATAAAAIALTAGGTDGPSCDLAAADVGRAWNPTSKEAVVRAFAASKRPHAAVTSSRVTAALDRHAAALGAARVAACEATHVRGEQSAAALDRRMACIDQRIDTMGALVSLYGRGADDELIDRAYEAVIALPDARDCAGAAQTGRPPPPAAIAAQVTAARRKLADANALRSAARFKPATEAYDALLIEARTLAYAPLTAEVSGGRAVLIDEIGEDAVAAERAYQDAAAAAASAADDHLIADAWIGQLGLLVEKGDATEALARLGFAEVAVSRAGGDELHEEFLVVRGDIYEKLSRFPEARADLEAARKSIEARNAGNTLPAGRIVTRLANVIWDMGENDAALALDQQMLKVWDETLGPDHPRVAQVLNNLAIRLDDAGRHAEAVPVLERSLSIKLRTYGPDNASVAYAYNNLARVYGHLGQEDVATTWNEKALALREKVLAPGHPLIASSLTNLAGNYNNVGRMPEALPLLQRALAIREKKFGPEHTEIANTLNTMAMVYMDLGRFDDALATARRGLAIREKLLGNQHPAVASSMTRLADIYMHMERVHESCAALDRAIAILEVKAVDHPDLVGPLTGRAECRLRRRDHAAAIADADRVIALVAASEESPWHAGRVRFIKAQALWSQAAARAESVGQARAALADFDGAPAGIRVEVAEIEEWLKRHPSK